jgi:arylsulfatase A-like enzyme
MSMLATLLLASTLAAPPNVLVILTDDQGWGDLSLHGNTNLRTPHIDSLAKEGASFDRFFVQPVCSPTRAEFLTGRYHTRCGVRNVTSGGERLNLDERTIAESFKAAGYRTAMFGKWHNGTQAPYHPLNRGFDEYYGFTSGHWGDYFRAPLDHNGRDVVGRGFITDDLTSHAIGFVTSKEKKPFFAYLAFNLPHSPMQVPDDDWNRVKDRPLPLSGTGKENRQHTRAAYAMCENLDSNIGRLLKALNEADKDRDTIIVYFHDNGPNGPRWNGGMKGTKGTTDEGGCRSPLFIRWPGPITAGRTIPAIAGAIDLAPTLCELAGIKRVGDKPLDGRSLARLLKGDGSAGSERHLIQTWNGRVSVRTQTHRLDSEGKLFDMVNDPNQTKPLGDSAEQNALLEIATKWKAEILADRMKPDDRPFTIGGPILERTELPARDGIPRGGIKRSANAPNCSFFTNWTRTTDAMVWPVDVLEAGNYRVDVWMTVPKNGIGSTIALRLGEAQATARLTVSHDPPLAGMENDRVPRVGESYVKPFQAYSLGTMTLAKGRGELRLTATEIPGSVVGDMRRVVFSKSE